jgi:Cu(I)/Ag(I) efflux system membrane fusion protein
MTTTRTLLLASLLVAAGFGAGRWGSGPAAPAQGGARAILHYVDPMHPAYRSDRPGIAPDCGMALEPVYADGGPAPGAGGAPRPAGTVTLDGQLRQLQGVRVGVVEKSSSAQSLRLFGRVSADEARVYVVNAGLDGSMRALSAVTAGSFVRKDQWLGAFFSADVRTPLQAYITALDVQDQDPDQRAQSGMQVAAGTSAGRSASFSVERLKGMGVSARQIEELRRKRDIPITIDVYAPVDGLVLARGVSLGQKFERGAEWFRIANLDTIWIVADLPDADAALARPGARALVTVPGRAAPLTAVVSQVPPLYDPMTRSLKLRLELANPGAVLRPEMFVDVALEVQRPPAITIPVDALVDSGLRKTVFVERGEGTFEPRAVETGWRAGGRVEIRSGLAAGDRIVTSGTFLVDSESQLKAAAAGIQGAASKDPVCGMEVDEARARAAGKVAQHAGHTYAFCSETCRDSFSAAPQRYLTAAAPIPGGGADGHHLATIQAGGEAVR